MIAPTAARTSLRRGAALAICAFAFTVGLSPSAAADEGQRGWFWYQEPPPPPKTKPKPAEKEAAPSSAPKVFSAQWIKTNLPEYLEKAVDDPTQKNVSAYMYLQKVMFDKAQNFAETFSQQATFNPALNPTTFAPSDSSSRGVFTQYSAEQKGVAIDALAKRAGLWFFFDSSCTFCSYQVTQLQPLLAMHPFDTFYISTDGKPLGNLPAGAHVLRDTGQAKKLHLVETPAVVLVWPPNNYLVLSQGATTTSSLEDRLLSAASYEHLLPQSILEWTNPYQRGVMTTDQINAATKDGIASPGEISQYVKKSTLDQIHR
jgi:conjugal transfer pilus assembly protein TraF